MFKKFSEEEDVNGSVLLKSSVQKKMRAKILEQMPHIEPYIEEILPKKEAIKLVKCRDHIEMLQGPDGHVQFVLLREGAFAPTLRLLHKYPFILPHMQVDKGAIKFVLNGSSIMCPGLTSPGAKTTDGVDKGRVVAVMAEGKEHALAIGMMAMSIDDLRQVNKGTGIENVHYLNDGLWHLTAKPCSK